MSTMYLLIQHPRPRLRLLPPPSTMTSRSKPFVPQDMEVFLLYLESSHLELTMTTRTDNANTGAIYPNRDGTWTGFIMTNNETRAFAEIEGAKLIIRPLLKDGKTPGKKPIATTRIVRRTHTTGPVGIAPDLETPLCIWSAKDKVYGARYLQLRPDRSVPAADPKLPF